MKGVFITFEGPEGSGKTTHAATVVERLRGAGLEVVTAREPGGTSTGEAIREILQHDRTREPILPETEALLFAASRAQLVGRVIMPALQRGCCVVCDRFADSTTAYQGYGRGFDVDCMLAISAFAVNGTEPDMTVLLDIPIDRGFARLAERHRDLGQGPDRFEREDIVFHEKVRQGYLELARRWPQRFRLVEADRPQPAVAADVWKLVAGLLADRGILPAAAKDTP